ncbi:MAG: creatininase family protein [Candidatus Borkfalkiaceae bacterium]|nr:creatininase family protein [Christensenellaceae bacterium]
MILDRSFPREVKYVQEKKIPLVIAGGTVEYHGPHCSYGCDTLVAEGLVKKLSEIKEIMIAPTISYSPSSYAVGGRTSGTVHVPERAFEDYVYYVFKSLLYAGFRNIYVVIHHQFEQEHEMPMTLCYRTAAKRATMEYLEETLGEGWWGSESYSDYYEQMEGANDPFSWIKVVPTMSTAVQNATGYDHAGKYESSILMALCPDCVKKERLGDVRHWFTESAQEANAELGEEMVRQSLAYLAQTIV